MSGKDAIINKILGDAKAQSEKILGEAKAKAEKSIGDAKAQSNMFINSEIEKAEASRPIIEQRKVAVANLEVRKIRLAAKQQVLDDTFKAAETDLNSLPEKEYKDLIFGMLRSAASDGDTVTVGKKDKGVLTAAFIAESSKKLGIKLKLDANYGDFSGGIILSGTNYDKNLTIDVELKTLREEIEPEIAQTIFGVKG